MLFFLDEIRLTDNKMGIRHTSKFGDSSIGNSQSVHEYSFVQSDKPKQNCSLLKYSTSFPVNIETEIQHQVEKPDEHKKQSTDSKTKKVYY